MKVGVVAHHSRMQMAHALAQRVSADHVSIDRGHLGPLRNHRLTWEYLYAKANPNEWCVVLEDDAVPVPNFLVQARTSLLWVPPKCEVASFYFGKLRPPQWQDRMRQAATIAEREDYRWITGDYVMHAVALAIPTPMVPHMLKATVNSLRPMDEAITQWCRQFGHRVAYSWPSLVDHADVPTVINHPDGAKRDKGRVAYKVGERESWNCRAIGL